MKGSRRLISFLVVCFLLAAIFIYSYYRGSLSPARTNVTLVPTSAVSPTSTAVTPVAYNVEEFASKLSVPWSLVFTAPNRLLFTERSGNVRVIQDGKLISEPLIYFSETISREEGGLMGLALHPNYTVNKWIYVSLDYQVNGSTYVKVERLADIGKTALRDRVIIDKIPGASLHTGSRIRFGPDGYLYITTGDATKKDLAQDPTSLAGKILRVADSGAIPADNPFPGSPIYSLGHRNPQGIDWHPQTGTLISTEHGPSGFDGPGGGDELNLIEKGKNYGWPTVSHDRKSPGLVPPLVVWTPAIAPASGAFYTGSVFPQFTNNYLFGGLRGEGLFRVIFDSSGKKVLRWEKLSDIANLGRIRDVVTGPDGNIYFSTSNTDGRGRVRSGDDKIIRLIPSD